MTHAMCSGQPVRTVQQTHNTPCNCVTLIFIPLVTLFYHASQWDGYSWGLCLPSTSVLIKVGLFALRIRCQNTLDVISKFPFQVWTSGKLAPQENMCHATPHFMCLDFTVCAGEGLTQPGPIFFFLPFS